MPTDEEIYNRYSQQIGREDQLTNSRIKWTLTVEGLLFAALSLVVRDDIAGLAEKLKLILPLLGISIAVISIGTSILAHISIYKLHKKWTSDYEHIDPSPFGAQYPGAGYLWNILGPSIAIPALVAVAWLFLLLPPLCQCK